MSNLYTLAQNYKAFQAFAEHQLDNIEDLTDDDIQVLIDTLDAVEDQLDRKLENVSKYIKNLEGDITAYKAEEERLQKRRKTLERKLKGLKEYTQSVLELNGIEKVNAGVFKVQLWKSPASVNVLNETLVPEEFKIKQPDKIDNKGLINALKSGQVIDGVELITDKKHLRIN